VQAPPALQGAAKAGALVRASAPQVAVFAVVDTAHGVRLAFKLAELDVGSYEKDGDEL